MKKVITYGTFDLLHRGHIKLLERAKELGNYLIVGVTSDDFDKARGKINVQQSLMERIEAVRSTGIADEIIVEEYEGQKIDDICRYGIDIFTVGSDWKGYFDYLKEYCEVIYLERTQGISSSEIRSEKRCINIGLVGITSMVQKVVKECAYVNGLNISGVFVSDNEINFENRVDSFEDLLCISDAIFLISDPREHYSQIRKALNRKKHVLCESPISLNENQSKELHELAKRNDCILMDSIKTAYSTAYSRMLLIAKSGKVGDIVSLEATATSLRDLIKMQNSELNVWNSINAWGPTVMLPVFQLFGTDYNDVLFISKRLNRDFDIFTQIQFMYEKSIATVKVGKGVKSEGELIISGTKGYIYVPAPWWKTDYFEIRYEDMSENRRYFYPLEGEGIRNELAAFVSAISINKTNGIITRDISNAICKVFELYYNDTNLIELR